MILINTTTKMNTLNIVLRVSQSTVVLCRFWPIMPVHSKIPICTFTFSDNPSLTPQDDS